MLSTTAHPASAKGQTARVPAQQPLWDERTSLRPVSCRAQAAKHERGARQSPRSAWGPNDLTTPKVYRDVPRSDSTAEQTGVQAVVDPSAHEAAPATAKAGPATGQNGSNSPDAFQRVATLDSTLSLQLDGANDSPVRNLSGAFASANCSSNLREQLSWSAFQEQQQAEGQQAGEWSGLQTVSETNAAAFNTKDADKGVDPAQLADVLTGIAKLTQVCGFRFMHSVLTNSSFVMLQGGSSSNWM